jgi:hypothetical protein
MREFSFTAPAWRNFYSIRGVGDDRRRTPVGNKRAELTLYHVRAFFGCQDGGSQVNLNSLPVFLMVNKTSLALFPFTKPPSPSRMFSNPAMVSNFKVTFFFLKQDWRENSENRSNRSDHISRKRPFRHTLACEKNKEARSSAPAVLPATRPIRI